MCVGSRVAPVLGNICLGKVDVSLEKLLAGKMVHIIRCVDDCTIVVPQYEASCNIELILKALKNNEMGLDFTSELPAEGDLQFLDVITFAENRPCWRYNRRSVKPPLNCISGRSKTVKRGIAMSSLASAVKVEHLAAKNLSRSGQLLSGSWVSKFGNGIVLCARP